MPRSTFKYRVYTSLCNCFKILYIIASKNSQLTLFSHLLIILTCLVLFQTEKKTKNWHRYADIIIPLVTLPLLLIIGLYFHHYISEKFNQENDKWIVFALSSFLLIISFIVFVYICIRLSAVLGGRTRLRLPMIRSNRSNVSIQYYLLRFLFFCYFL